MNEKMNCLLCGGLGETWSDTKKCYACSWLEMKDIIKKQDKVIHELTYTISGLKAAFKILTEKE